MKRFLSILFVFLINSALATPIQVAVSLPSGLQVGKNMVLAQVQADASYNGTPVMLVVDPGNSQAVQEISLGKIGDSSFQGEVDLTSLNANPSLTIKVSKPDARYAATQVIAANATSAVFTLDAPRTGNRAPYLYFAGFFFLVGFGILGAMALRGEKTAF